MSSYEAFAKSLQFAQVMRCASPLSSSVDIPVSSRPKVWKNENCANMETSKSIDELCTMIEERLNLGTECQETSECSSPAMTSALTFEENCKRFSDLVEWIKDCQRRHAEEEPFLNKNGKMVGESATRRRYKLNSKVHSKVFKTAVESSSDESSGEETEHEEATVNKPSVKNTSIATKKNPAVNKRTPPNRIFPPRKFTPAKLYTLPKEVAPIKKVVTPIKKMASVTRANGENDEVKVKDFAYVNSADKKQSTATTKSALVKKSFRQTNGNTGEVKVWDFAYGDHSGKPPKPAATNLGRRDSFFRAD